MIWFLEHISPFYMHLSVCFILFNAEKFGVRNATGIVERCVPAFIHRYFR